VPYYEFKGHRDILNDHFRRKEEKFREGKVEESMDQYVPPFISFPPSAISILYFVFVSVDCVGLRDGKSVHVYVYVWVY
jgi:hypothetical protein